MNIHGDFVRECVKLAPMIATATLAIASWEAGTKTVNAVWNKTMAWYRGDAYNAARKNDEFNTLGYGEKIERVGRLFPRAEWSLSTCASMFLLSIVALSVAKK